VPCSVTRSTPEHDVLRVVDDARLYYGDGVAATILFTLYLFLSCCQAPPKGVGYRAHFITAGTSAKVRRGGVLLSSDTDAPSALKHEEIVSSFRDEMLSTATIAKTSFVIRIRAALTEDQRALGFMVTGVVAGGTFLLMALSERIIGRKFVEDLLGGDNLRT